MSERVARDAAIGSGQYPGEATKLRRESAVGFLDVTFRPSVRIHGRSKALWATEGLDVG
jgi:hypothetical protein